MFQNAVGEYFKFMKFMNLTVSNSGPCAIKLKSTPQSLCPGTCIK